MLPVKKKMENYFKDKHLQEPIPITEHNWDDNSVQLVSVSCTTYNHEPYIRDAIEGFLMQKTTFPVKIVIFEDCSTDNTAKILKDYNAIYPGLFSMFLMKENTYKKPFRRKAGEPFRQERSKAKYIAMCEGDDYWTDPLKLQKQVDFMEANGDCSLCYHKTRVKMVNNSIEDSFFGAKGIEGPTIFTLEDFIKTNNAIGIRTVAMLIRTEVAKSISKWQIQTPLGDLKLQLYSGLMGNYGYLPDEMAVYNRGNPGSWSDNTHTIEWHLKRARDSKKLYTLFDEFTNYNYSELINKKNEKGIRNGIDEVQLAGFSRSEQFKMMKKNYKKLIIPDKRNLVIWMRFFLGSKSAHKLIKSKK